MVRLKIHAKFLIQEKIFGSKKFCWKNYSAYHITPSSFNEIHFFFYFSIWLLSTNWSKRQSCMKPLSDDCHVGLRGLRAPGGALWKISHNKRRSTFKVSNERRCGFENPLKGNLYPQKNINYSNCIICILSSSATATADAWTELTVMLTTVLYPTGMQGIYRRKFLGWLEV